MGLSEKFGFDSYFQFPKQILCILNHEKADYKLKGFVLELLSYIDYLVFNDRLSDDGYFQIKIGHSSKEKNFWNMSRNTFRTYINYLVNLGILEEARDSKSEIRKIRINSEKIKEICESYIVSPVQEGFPTVEKEDVEEVRNKVTLTETDIHNLQVQLGLIYYPIQSSLKNENSYVKNNVDFLATVDDDCGYCCLFNEKPDDRFISKLYSNISNEYYWVYLVWSENQKFKAMKIPPKIKIKNKINKI